MPTVRRGEISSKSMLDITLGSGLRGCNLPNADTTVNVTKCIFVVAMAMFSRLYGTMGDSRSNSNSFQPSRSIAVSRMSHFFHLARSIDAIASRSKYLCHALVISEMHALRPLHHAVSTCVPHESSVRCIHRN